MNSKVVKQLVIAGVLVVVLLVILWMQFFRKTTPPAKPGNQKAAKTSTTKSSAAKGAKGTGEEGPAFESQFKEDVDLDQLLTQIKEVEFSYDSTRPGRNPMTPLVGVIFPKNAGIGEGGDAGAMNFEVLSVAQRMALSGIIWDPVNPLAVIDNAVVSPGYEFPGGIVVDSITQDKVVLRVQSTTIIKELKEQ